MIDRLATICVTAMILAGLIMLAGQAVEDWRRVQRYQACEACVESEAPGICGPICGYRTRASPDSETAPPPVGGGMGYEDVNRVRDAGGASPRFPVRRP